MKIRRLAIIICCCLATAVQAQIQGAGSSVFHFLGLPASSRLNALGGENVAIADGDISMAFVNPALLTASTDNVLQLNYAYYLAGTMFGSAMYGHNFGRSKIERPYTGSGEPDKPNYFAVGIHYLDYGTMRYADENGNLTGGTFSARDICINAMYARQLGPYFTVGVTLKPIYSIYEAYSSFSLGADVGGHYQTADSALHVGLALRNIGWQMKAFYSEESGQHTEMLPLNLELGLSYRLAHAPIRFSLTIHNMQKWYIGVPQEVTEKTNKVKEGFDMAFRHTIWAIDIVPRSNKYYLTLSYNHRLHQEMNMSETFSLSGFAAGVGVNIYKFRLGFAVSQYSRSNLTYQVSLSTDINSFMK